MTGKFPNIADIDLNPQFRQALEIMGRGGTPLRN